MSALPTKADMCGATRNVCFGPIADMRILRNETSGFPAGAVGSSAAPVLLQLLHNLVDAEARRLLARRILSEGPDELGHQSLRRHDDERAVERPLVVAVRRNISPLVGVHAQVEHFGRAHADERLAPDLSRAFDTHLAEYDFPVSGTEANELAVVVEVEELLARRFILLAGQVGKLVVAVEMHVVGAPSGLPSSKQSILDAGVARGGEQGWEPINSREYLVRDAACPDVARPAHECWHAEGAFPVRHLLVAERRVAAGARTQ